VRSAFRVAVAVEAAVPCAKLAGLFEPFAQLSQSAEQTFQDRVGRELIIAQSSSSEALEGGEIGEQSRSRVRPAIRVRERP
jgi:hypothetical protein